MTRLYFYVEGQTEQEYVSRVLIPHLAGFGVYAMNPVLAASGRRHGKTARGGGERYQPMRRDLGFLLKQEAARDVRFTTMFDLYALYDGFPGWAEAEKLRHLPYQRVQVLEKAFGLDVADHRFIPHITLHEFETILLCEPEYLASAYENAGQGIASLRAAVTEATCPELVDDGATSAPSKRIIAQFPRYAHQKTTVGVDIAACVGIERTRRLCPHFHSWLQVLEALGQ